MGNKFRLLPWIGTTLSRIDFRTALDGFSGSGCVGYLMKCMGKSVVCNDFLNYASHVANALIANSRVTISDQELDFLLEENSLRDDFIARTFRNIFFSEADNEFLDNVWANLNEFGDSRKRSLVIAALCRSCIKKQPRGVFTTVTANNGKYRDGRRDLRLSLREHFVESVKLFNSLIFDNGQEHRALCSDIFSIDPDGYDLVYFDPPYVPRSDDNCYIKRYHFLEGLSCYWQGMEIVESSVVKKIKKRYTPFSYRRTSIEAFRDLFHRFRESVIVLSYSSNGYPDKEILLSLLREAKGSDNVFVETEPHTYHFGTHGGVNPGRKHIQEYLFIGA
jgi:DNA adenine methylase/adenine-specific DNA-methyltransferase